jgi:hypothetical protein
LTVLLSNNAESSLASGISNSDTVITVATGDGALFPDPQGDDWFPVTLVDSSANIEIAHCTSRTGDALTVIRGREDTTPRAFGSGDIIDHRFTAFAFESMGNIKTVEDPQTLLSGQLVVTFAGIDTAKCRFYISGIDVDSALLYETTDYSVDSATQITLTQSYPAGSVVTAVENDHEGIDEAHSHANKSVLDATTASFTTAEETKLASAVIDGGGAAGTITKIEVVSSFPGTPDANTLYVQV